MGNTNCNTCTEQREDIDLTFQDQKNESSGHYNNRAAISSTKNTRKIKQTTPSSLGFKDSSLFQSYAATPADKISSSPLSHAPLPSIAIPTATPSMLEHVSPPPLPELERGALPCPCFASELPSLRALEEKPLGSATVAARPVLLESAYLYLSSLSTYKGHFLYGQRTHFGVQQDADGDVYWGMWKNDAREGYGYLIINNGDRYAGEWLGNAPHGKGEYWFAGGRCVIQARFEKGEVQGQGKEIYADGTYYQGEFVKGVKQGVGVFVFDGGARYCGDFFEDRIEGKGVYTDEKGVKYEGQFKNNKRSGKGVLTLPTGEIYEGFFRNGAQEGQGKLVW